MFSKSIIIFSLLITTFVCASPPGDPVYYKASRGDAKAQFEYGERQYGSGRFSKALEWLGKSANQDYLKAQIYLGKIYCFGLGMEHDTEKGFTWLEKAAKQGHIETQLLLGEMYATGVGDILKSPERSMKWYKAAADAGDPIGLTKLGNIYFARHTTSSYEVAKGLYEQAVEKNHPEAQYRLGRLYSWGRGVKEDKNRARLLWLQAIKHDAPNYDAMWYLGVSLIHVRNSSHAYEYLLKAANHGHVNSQASLAKYYTIGIGTYSNPKEGNKWYLKAALNGHAESQYKIGTRLISGYHIEKDPVKGAQFIKKAYENGWKPAAAYWLSYEVWKYESKDSN